MSDMLRWFESGKGVVAILDATNSTKERRAWIYEKCRQAGVETLFVESICDDEDLIMTNILEVKTTSPDYKDQDPEAAALDFRTRIRNYEKVYETIDDHEKHYTYVKLINVGSTVIINQIKDYLSSRLVYYIQNLHIKPRSIWLSRVSSTDPICYNYPNTNPARRVRIQPDRPDWRRLQHLRARGAVRSRTARPPPQIGCPP
jgi:6-phosphofructo-2-kinase/fructose-2,6-biphosphatase 2